MKSLRSARLKDKRVFVRVDFNVPVENNKVTEDTRIRAAIPTINYLLKSGVSQIILASHRGRPEGKDPSLSMAPVALKLSKLLKQKVFVASDVLLPALPKDRIILLENLRFYPEEEKNNPDFAKKLSSYADIYVNDAFGTAHRAHASVEAITHFLPSYPGFLLEKEVTALSKVKDVKHPFLVILGGGKADKMGLVKSLLEKADAVFVGGVLGNILLQAKGVQVGTSKSDSKALEEARSIVISLSANKLLLPIDVLVAKTPKDKPLTVAISSVPNVMAIFDIGPNTIKTLIPLIKKAKTIFLAGPAGLFEEKNFRNGTFTIAKLVSSSKAIKVCGGGDSAVAISKQHLEKKFTHISTGGGAALEFVEGKSLPGIEALR